MGLVYQGNNRNYSACKKRYPSLLLELSEYAGLHPETIREYSVELRKNCIQEST
ncbi:MAG: hypothetical protein HRO68_01060 [Nitrosopumilus sp.]|nr:hypothetical protein [Nitrosopumilus sp.]